MSNGGLRGEGTRCLPRSLGQSQVCVTCACMSVCDCARVCVCLRLSVAHMCASVCACVGGCVHALPLYESNVCTSASVCLCDCVSPGVHALARVRLGLSVSVCSCKSVSLCARVCICTCVPPGASCVPQGDPAATVPLAPQTLALNYRPSWSWCLPHNTEQWTQDASFASLGKMVF